MGGRARTSTNLDGEPSNPIARSVIQESGTATTAITTSTGELATVSSPRPSDRPIGGITELAEPNIALPNSRRGSGAGSAPLGAGRAGPGPRRRAFLPPTAPPPPPPPPP